MPWMEIARGLVLGLVQGLTEFLPVSSSGHLILVPALFGWPDQGLAFDTVLHLGTLAALLWFFGGELKTLAVRVVRPGEREAALVFFAKLAAATLPAIIVALLFGGWIEANARSAWIVAGNLALWGILLFIADHRSRDGRGKDAYLSISWTDALIIGCAQALALIPGTSRSGVTITTALFLGFTRPAAARFSFLLALPVTFLAGADGFWKILGESTAVSWPALITGFLAAAVSGAFAITFLLSYVSKRRYDVFAAYRLALAAIVIAVLS